MAVYSEEEQVEQIRKWWSENGASLLLTIAIAIAAIVGWRWYQDSRDAQAAQASLVYQEMLTALEQAQARPDSAVEAERAEASANTLVEQFPDSSYADFARLLLAKLAVEDGELDVASKWLTEVVESPAMDAQGWVARLRLVRLSLQKDDADAALASLEKTFPEAFLGEALELKGDALRLKGDIDGARAAYAAALEALSGDSNRELVQMKLDDLVPAS